MKKLVGILFISFLTFTSCESDDDSNDKDNDSKTLTVEQGKQSLEDNSIKVLNEIEAFRDDAALTEVEEFLNFLTTDEDQSEIDNAFLAKLKKTLATTSDIKENNISPVKFSSTLIQELSIADEHGLQDDFNELVGTHTWNEQEGEFNHVEANDDKIIFNITQNNKTAILTVSNFATFVYDSGDELPESIKIELTVDGTKIMGVDESVTIASNDLIPSNISASMTLGELSYTSKFNNDSTNASISQSLNIGDTKILGLNLNLNGDFTNLNTDEDIDFSLLLNTLDVTLSLGDTSIIVDAKYFDELNEGLGEDIGIEESLTLLNDNFNVIVKSGDNKVADGEIYYYNEENTEDDGTEEGLDIKLVFEDGSKSTLEAYFEVGFDNVLESAEDLLEVYNIEEEDENIIVIEEEVTTGGGF